MDIMAQDTYGVFGFCRVAVGGYCIWKERPESVTPLVLLSEDGLRDTTINRTNYAALERCLDYIIDHAQQSADEVTIRCGCFMVCRQVEHTLRSIDLQAECDRVLQRMARLSSLGIAVRVVYDRHLTLPKSAEA